MWNNNLLFAEDDDWRRLRQISSPVFTSGKLKLMHGLMNRCINNLVEYLDEIVQQKDGLIEDAKKVCNGFSLDVIFASCFATELNANNPQEAGNAVLKNAKEMLNINPLRAIASFCFPSRLLYLLGIKTLFNEQPFEFFVQLTQEILKQRKTNPQKARNDLVQSLMKAKAEDSTEGDSTLKGKTLSESEIIAQCILLFIGGFETTSLTLFHAIYELSQNASVQERLYQSIVEGTGNVPDEESSEYFDIVLNRLPYLDAVLKEVLRKYPPLHMVHRRLQTDGYILGGVSLPKDVSIEISSYTCHYNAAFYPDPQRFEPNRFLSPNLEQHTAPYLPFGLGPKTCLGKRFALQELKLCLAKLVRRYTFEPTERTAKFFTFYKILPLLVTNTTPIKVLIR